MVITVFMGIGYRLELCISLWIETQPKIVLGTWTDPLLVMVIFRAASQHDDVESTLDWTHIDMENHICLTGKPWNTMFGMIKTLHLLYCHVSSFLSSKKGGSPHPSFTQGTSLVIPPHGTKKLSHLACCRGRGRHGEALGWGNGPAMSIELYGFVAGN